MLRKKKIKLFIKERKIIKIRMTSVIVSKEVFNHILKATLPKQNQK